MKSRGFTLIELMIVVAIIAIIAAIAIPNLMRSRMAANETAAIASCKAYASAQYIFRRTDYNKDGVLEFAQRLSGDNSLFETSAGKADLGLIDRGFANAEGAPQVATPRSGYVFNVLTSQGANASGKAFSYLDPKGHLTIGFGLGATSNQYDGVGRNTFVINNAGTIYEIDQGSAGTPPTLYNPSSSWVVAE